MKKYIEPKIKAIKLDSEAAILSTCQSAGGQAQWIYGGQSCVAVEAGSFRITGFCQTGWRGDLRSSWRSAEWGPDELAGS